MIERLIARMLAPLARAVSGMLVTGTVVLSNSDTKLQTLQIKILAGDGADGIEHFEAYGLTARPKAGAEHVTLFFGGDRSHGVTIMVADRRYRLKGLAEGEVALYDDLGQKVHLTRSGMVIDGGGLPLMIQNSPHVTADTLKLTVTGDLEVQGKADVTGNITTVADLAAVNVAASSGVSSAGGALTMADIKTKFNAHIHSDPQGGTVSAPSVTM